MFISAVYGGLHRSVCVGTGGSCSPGFFLGGGLVVGVGGFVAELRDGGLMCWGWCVFVMECVRSVLVFSVKVRLDSGIGCVV